ncbi:MAG: ATP-binding protein [Bacteroidales bacterium]|nr:ATP-binding protein [Bacteroidales bacterium]
MVKRDLEPLIRKHLFKNKAIIIYGARQVGKTTLVEQLVRDHQPETLFLNGDDANVREALTNVSSSQLLPIIGNRKIVIIDEAQRITETGLVLKIIHDNFRDVQLIATGSSSFELAGKINEPMTGRKFEFHLHPFSFGEMTTHHGFLTEKGLLENRMIFGYYPDIALHVGQELKLLKTLVSSFLYKDLLNLEQIQKPALLEKILKALAMQVGNEVTYNELAQLLDSDKGTIEKYIDLLEKAYIIFKLNGLSRNVRNEIKKGRKIYFYDNGVRNAILGNFLTLSSRIDTGALWENFLISERQKFLGNKDIEFQRYFWRTTQQQEIDYIEEREGKLHAYEFKWNPKSKSGLSKTFSAAYPGSEFKIISPENIHLFLSEES